MFQNQKCHLYEIKQRRLVVQNVRDGYSILAQHFHQMLTVIHAFRVVGKVSILHDA